MGGDFAPGAAVEGALLALEKLDADSRIVMFGDEARIREIIAAHDVDAGRMDIVPTSEVIGMGDHPAEAFRHKPDSSIAVGFAHLAAGRIDGFASAGSTGAMIVGSMYSVRPIEGVIRPTIATAIPTVQGSPVLILDLGLNVDCKPEVLEQYAVIGSIYSESVLGIHSPRVALLNIGEESAKGNAQTKAAHELMAAAGKTGKYNFAGNIEASHIFSGKVADVVVCDGFTGNVLLKLSEGFYHINRKMGLGNNFWEGMNYERTGGTPVLGVNSAVTIGHGKSTPLAICNMILSTENTIRTGLVKRLQQAFAEQA